MADKYPELEVSADEQDVQGDFLSREKELLGDEFQTEQDNEVLAESDDDIQEFKEQFPEVDNSIAAEPQEESEDDEFENFGSAPPVSQELGESEPLKEWRERRTLEIEEREKANRKKKEEIVAAARQSIDDFYDNYNNKKDQHAKDVLKEEEEFLEKRDGFLKRGTLWDRVNELVSEVGEVSDDGRDKSRFDALLKKLKGKENVPGAGGY
ncbi:putative clathrin light chain [Clavispora lusitaniae]|uniref:Clathrin light chain n=3 Tax=Clavispora lusitaniae TaxID=36911 RepID=C4XWM2_CLAL4|nr:uncharacterized protein CLUG_00345 [Clavispora lusitaniae ATCC 42720]KAF5213261.1 hypothetical protein E0198_000778 [Clavispora lusitaniae]EEQ36222.1 hypothetical protein CLUG_00345 [Clavispora lusitaniae ATCC 42720]KAF7584271.1 Clathrin light chain family protein [Clavispora lusitaniae]OVF08453.1 putative clathrin light chain [Clavispora lusitaniae]QFZ25270.1 putative clathrin light chain [Clavispora lusitaniae]